jgi:hypothetical protein
VLLCAYPILILNIPVFDLNNHWYFYAVVLAFFSTIDPFFRINFARHKITDFNYAMCIFRIAMSIIIACCAFVLPLLGTKPHETTEQTNDIFFIIFSLFCFSKFLTLFTHVILKNRVVRKSMILVRHTWPFVINMGMLLALILLFYAHIGRILFGGLIHNLSVNNYTTKTGLNLRPQYQYFHFNDIFSSLLTLLALLIQNNWIYVTELLFFVNQTPATVAFVISFQILATFILTSLFFGVISRLIMISFESDFDHFDTRESSMVQSIETATHQSASVAPSESRKI